MAVFTKLSSDEIRNCLKPFSTKQIAKVSEIKEGSENSNYLITLEDGQKLIFTIFEKRLNKNHLPFYLELLKHLNNNDFLCPVALENNNKNFDFFGQKPFCFFTFLEGKMTLHPNYYQIEQLVLNMAKFHKISHKFAKTYSGASPNEFCFEHLLAKYKHIYKNVDTKVKAKLPNLLKTYKALDKSNLKKTIIHGDLFKDNVFFKGDRFAGFIDFFFAHKGYVIQELAIVINDWCFSYKNGHLEFNVDYYLEIISLYKYFSPLSKKDLNALPLFLIITSLCFYFSRLEDKVLAQKNIKEKDPKEYLQKFLFHSENKLKFIHL